jgi:hypothetical protein
MKYTLVLLLLLVAMLSGCASGGPRTVELQTKTTSFAARHSIEASELKVTVSDKRADRSIDQILSQKVPDTIKEVIDRSLRETKAITIQPAADAPMEIVGELTKLEWFVPGYDAMLKKVFVASFLTGGLGGVAYGSTETPVQGNVTIKLTALKSGQELLSREYVGIHEEKMAKLKCDVMTTKSRMAGLALSHAVEKFIRDLDSIGSVAATPVSPPAAVQ